MPQVRTKPIIETKQKASGTKGNQELQTKKKKKTNSKSPIYERVLFLDCKSNKVSPGTVEIANRHWLS